MGTPSPVEKKGKTAESGGGGGVQPQPQGGVAGEPRSQGAQQDQQKPFVEAHYDYMRSLQKARAEAHEGLLKLQRTYQETVEEVRSRTARQIGEAMSECERSLREAAGGENPQQQWADAERTCMKRRRELEEQARESLERAARDHQQALQEHRRQAREREQEAERDYLRAVQKAWGGLDPDALDAQSLETIAQTLVSVAACERQSAWMASLP